ncbi:MAG TPA: tripartite tricarboxylate transporter TctB family protein [Microvirga sp.]
MSSSAERTAGPVRSGPVRSPQSLLGGLMLLALAALALYLTRDLAQGTLRAMGPAMLPRWLAIAVGLSGLALVAFSFVKVGDALERWSLRGPLFVILAIFAFAVTIRPFSFGTLSTPGLGLLVAGPLAIVIGGHASPEARIRDLAILALSLTPFCMLLFGDALGLAIPMFPQPMTGLFPDGWSQKAVLRTTAAILAGIAILVFLLTRGRREPTTEVAGHSGQI